MSRRKTLAGVAVVLVAALAWGLMAGSSTEAQDGRSTNQSDDIPTARATRKDLVERQTFDGTLGYADTRALLTAAQGTVTAMAEEGSTVERGGMLYSINGRTVLLLYGGTPAWRTLAEGVDDGEDIRQLEENLVAMGYDPDGDIEVDDEFDWATTAAVKRWQDDLGVDEDGVIELGDVVFLPGPRRIGAHKVGTGALITPGTEVLETSSMRRVVTLDLEADQQTLVEEGDRVRVQLPDGRTVLGTVAEVGNVAEYQSSDEGESGEESESDPTIKVTVRLGPGANTGRLDQAPVDVEIAKQVERDALAVPVTALLALAEGGYAVEVKEGRTTRLVAVRTGMYADGWVQIAGKGIAEGTQVVVAE